MSQDYIRLENLNMAYHEGPRLRCVLCDLSAGFAHGEFVAILGKSGSGKSTLLNIISSINCADIASPARRAKICSSSRTARKRLPMPTASSTCATGGLSRDGYQGQGGPPGIQASVL